MKYPSAKFASMVPSLRKAFNSSFSNEKYSAFLEDLDQQFPGAIEFRLAETPIFIPRHFADAMVETCESIIDLIKDPKFITLTRNAIPPSDKVPGNYGFPQTLVFDFGICLDDDQSLTPMLVEMQGFPSLYAFQSEYPETLRKYFDIPANYSQFLGGHDKNSFEALFRRVILGKHSPENVILLEIEPHLQKTRIDFYYTSQVTGVIPVCITELEQEGKKLFYWNQGLRTPVHRIYNRLIFDELHDRTDLHPSVDIRDDLDLEWVPHPDWFYRVSKYTLPLISHPSVPETYFLNEVKQLPANLGNYVLKPLFSFAGQGVVIDVTPGDIEKITDPEDWILQKKVRYADVIETPDGPAKAEVRIMYLWEEGANRPQPIINLARLSKGKMIGTRYNQDKTWVGGSVAFIER